MAFNSEEYYQKNKEKIKAYQRWYKKAKREGTFVRLNEIPGYFEKKKEERRLKNIEYQRLYRENNREAYILYQREYYKKNKKKSN